MLKYVKSSSMIKPEEIDDSSSQYTTYIHKNIEEKTETGPDGETRIYYEYDEAKLTKMEYLQMQVDEAYINSEYAATLAELEV